MHRHPKSVITDVVEQVPAFGGRWSGEMLVRDIAVTAEEHAAVLTAEVESAQGLQRTLEYRVQGRGAGALSSSGDPFLAALLAPSMALGEDLEIDAPLSTRLLAATDEIQDIYQAWGSGLQRVRIRGGNGGPGSVPASASASAIGMPFTAGVDSFYVLLKNLREVNAQPITHLVFVRGFDIKLNDARRYAMASDKVKRAAEQTGSEPIYVTSNVRDFGDGLPWGELYHGAALASVGLALNGLLGRLVVASSWAYQNLRPWGSHPLLDPLWSTEGLEVVHDGCEARRSEKVRSISASPVALDNLRVCWAHLTEDLNCGRCEKCISTMAMLASEGALARSATFPDALSIAALRHLPIKDESTWQVLDDLLVGMRQRGQDGELAEAIEYALRPPRRRRAIRHARRRLRPVKRFARRVASAR